MASINLLDWRSERRAAKQKEYTGVLLFVAIVALGISVLCVMTIDNFVSAQNSRNQFLQTQVDGLNNQIAEIKKIKKQKDNLEKRAEIIISLQEARNIPTHVLNQLANVVPKGIYFTKLDKQAKVLWIEGYAESNNILSNMMRNIKANPMLSNPQISFIETEKKANTKLRQFKLKATIKEKMEETKTQEKV